MKISYDPAVDALYIRLIDDLECEMVQLTNWVTINIGLNERVAGIEILDASEFIADFEEKKIVLENLVPG